MLVFVTPLKSAGSSHSWERVARLVGRTVRSACAQACPDFRVIVACHEVPEIRFEDKRLEFLQVGFEPPGFDPLKRKRDKERKLLAGLRRSLAFRPSHVMPLDADDCIRPSPDPCPKS